MKNSGTKLTIILLLFTFCVACQKDLLETSPKDQLNNSSFWKTKQDAVNAVNALYPFLPDYTEVDWDRMTDIATTNTPSQATVTIERGEHDASLPHFKVKWDDGYKAIRAANYFLENADKVKQADATMDETTLTRLKSEARFIRAFFYVRLIMLFGDVPLITKNIDITEAKSVSRTSKAQVWDFVESEFTEMAIGLPNKYTGNDIGRITKGAALAMKARAMLYAERWDKAAAAAKAVMDLKVYSINPSFKTLFSYAAENSNEIILSRQFAKGVISHSFFATHAPVSLNGNVGLSPSRTLADAFETINGKAIADDLTFNPLNPYANRDPRLGYTLFIPTFSDNVPGEVLFNGRVYDPRPGSGTGDEVERDFFRTKTGFSIKKYINIEDKDDRSNGGTNFILIRYADVLLMYAEAKIKLDQIDASVYSAINEVRQRADVNMPKITTGNVLQLPEIVRHERMVELALEGLRFFDIRRWKTAKSLMQGTIPGMHYIPVSKPTVMSEIKTLTYNGVTRTFNSARDYLFPIPQEERVLVPSLTQNPEY